MHCELRNPCAAVASVAGMTDRPVFHTFAFDCPDPRALAVFYLELLGYSLSPDSDDEWVTITGPGPQMSFQLAPDHVPPQWPSAEHPQQMHLDLDVTDLDAAEEAVLALGARKHEHQPGKTFRVFLDPAGHPFCLCQV